MILARTVVDLPKPTFAVLVMNLSDEERVVREGTEVACCESVEYVTLISQDEVNTKQDGSQLHRSLQELYDRSTEGLEYSEKRKLHALLLEYRDIFSKDDQDLGRTSITSHKIHTGASKPVRQLPRCLPISQVDEARKAIETMAKDGIIEQSSSPWMAPIVLVKKKDGTT